MTLLLRTMKSAVRWGLRLLDIDIHRYSNSPMHRRIEIMKKHRITLLVDAGANKGQYALQVRGAGYAGRIVSFEPLSSAYTALKRNARQIRDWRCERLAVGDFDGETTINVAENSVSSSLLPMENRHVGAAPESRYVAQETVRVARLDTLCREICTPEDRIYLKLDVQGFEMQALRGATRTLEQVQVIESELSLVPLYHGQALLPEVVAFLYEAGFVVASVEEAFRDPQSYQLLQTDCIFVRSGNG